MSIYSFFRQRLAVKFVTLVVIILFTTLGGSALLAIERQQRLMQEQLVEQGRILSRFASMVSAEAILAYDFLALESYVRDITQRQDIVYSIVLDPSGAPLTSYLDRDKPLVRSLARQQPIETIQQLHARAIKSPAFLVESFPITNNDGEMLGSFVVGISRARLEQELHTSLFSLLVGYGLITLILSGAIFLVFRQSVLFPIRELIRGSQRVADGNYKEAVTINSNDELGMLSRAFNSMMRDVDKDQELLHFQANFDTLTGLPNRGQAIARLKEEIARAEREKRRFSVIFVDLNNFKYINDTMGHQAGDVLLVELSKRFISVLRESDLLARLGGDEFLLLLPTSGEAEQAEHAAQRLIATLSSPVKVEERDIYLRCSMGIAIYPIDGASSEQLMANADNAMYQAKRDINEDIRFFTPAMNQSIQEIMLLEHDLHLAMEHHELQLYYQPIVDAHSHRPIGAEVLLRWLHPKKGLISPASFIPLAESTGKIVEIGSWVLRQSLLEFQQLSRDGLAPGFISINVSQAQLSSAFPAMVAEALRSSGLPAALLHLEVTESALVENHGEVPHILRQLDEMGIKLTLDDFGTGYSSLNYLKNFPFKVLKIDKSFIDGVPSDEGDTSLVRAIIAMSNSLGLKVIAEGVEQAHQNQFLLDSTVDTLQGYLFAKPMPLEEYRNYLQQHAAVA